MTFMSIFLSTPPTLIVLQLLSSAYSSLAESSGIGSLNVESSRPSTESFISSGVSISGVTKSSTGEKTSPSLLLLREDRLLESSSKFT
uniref:Putative secreted protein n=1 Tax=Ixodes ricinus TaxID=34613 RepID=A0A6B0UFS3_IXORI